jgi:lysophospholipase L1-like esterase
MNHRTQASACVRAVLAWGLAMIATSVFGEERHKFQFSDDVEIADAINVAAGDPYNADCGYGFLESVGDTAARLFVVDLPEGNYDVSVRFGSRSEATSTTVKAETRRLIFRELKTKAGEFVTREFTVNVRQPTFGEGQKVGLTGREYGPPMSPSWDGQLSLEFNGEHPGVAAIQIQPNADATTVFLAGDSTVTDQRNEPWSGWGQMLPSFFESGVAVSNQAESGLALFSFRGQRRLNKVLSMMKEGDYLFIQFGHNDQKDRREGAGASTTYKKDLEEFVAAAREKGGIPVLVTPMERRRWKGGKAEMTLGGYAEAVRQVGKEMKVPVIDLQAKSLELYEALGEEGSTKAFVFYPANTFPGQDKELKDNTHHSPYGGYELARCVVEGIKAEVPELAERLLGDVGEFSASKPDKPEDVFISATPIVGDGDKPDGN